MEKTEVKEIEGVLVEFTRNKNYVKIKKCCASCQTHSHYDDNGPRRKCTKHDKIVNKNDCCDDWSISDAINEIKLRPYTN